jgi:hypothetical protein
MADLPFCTKSCKLYPNVATLGCTLVQVYIAAVHDSVY